MSSVSRRKARSGYSIFGAIEPVPNLTLLRLWPAALRRALDRDLRLRVAPQRVKRKLAPAIMRDLRGRFLVADLGRLPSDAIAAHYTYADMTEIARHGEDHGATRLYRWFRASLEAGRPVLSRGTLYDEDAKIVAYYRRYLDLYRDMAKNGYRYAGPDEIAFGIAADGEILHVRRGSHRLAAAQILDLPWVEGRIVHIDPAWLDRCPNLAELRLALRRLAVSG